MSRNRAVRISRHRSLTTSSRPLEPDHSCVDARQAPSDFGPSSAVVYTNALTQTEGDLITKEILSRMKRRRYEKGHWDAVIVNYKEVEMSDFSFDTPEIPNIFHRVRQHLAEHHLNSNPVEWLPCHAIDLKKEGELTAHVDSIKFSGDLVAGVSLLSPSIMRLVPDDGTDEQNEASGADGWVDLYLPPLSLYALTGVGRYRYSHQLLPDNSAFSKADGTKIKVQRDHRLSVIFRDAKPSI